MRYLLALALVITAATGTSAASAQSYPAKPIRIIVSTTPGGATDIMARILGHHITARTGQPHVIDNRAGASGNIGTNAVAKAAPDGLTIGLSILGPLVINPLIMKSVPYDPETDVTPISHIASQPSVLVVPTGSGVATVEELVARLKAEAIHGLH